MATLEELVVELRAETSGLRAELKNATAATSQATQAMTKSVEAFASTGGKNVSTFQTAMGTMAGFIGGQAVIGAFSAASGAVLRFAQSLVVDGVAAAQEEEDALSSLAVAFSNSGKEAGSAALNFAKFASEMQNTTKFADDAVISAGALIESLGALDQQGLQRATTAALDLSQALGVDLKTAATLVGKAAAGEVGSLSRYGIAIEEGGTKAEKFEKVLAKISERFGGSAAAALQTYSGATAKLGNTYGDLQESIGNTIIKNVAVVGVVNAVSKVFEELKKVVDENAQGLRTFVAAGLVVAIGTMQGLIQVTDILWRILKTLGQGFVEVGQTIGAASAAVLEAVSGNFQGAADIIKESLGGSFDDLKASLMDQTALSSFNDSLDKVADSAAVGFELTKQGAEAMIPSLDKAKAKVNELSEAEKQRRDQLKSFTEELVKNSQDESAQKTQALEMAQSLRDQDLISEEEYLAQRQEIVLGFQEQERAMLEEARADKLLSEEEYNAAALQLEQQQTLDRNKEVAKRIQFEKDQNKQRSENLRSTLDTISTLSSSSNKTLAAIGKASAISTATIDGIAAVQKALASAPPPFNFALAALVGAATAANVAKIAGVGLATGIDSVPGSGNRDNFPAVLAPGERVVPRETNKELTAFLEQQQNEPRSVQLTVNIQGDVFDSDDTGPRLVEHINNSLARGGMRIINV